MYFNPDADVAPREPFGLSQRFRTGLIAQARAHNKKQAPYPSGVVLIALEKKEGSGGYPWAVGEVAVVFDREGTPEIVLWDVYLSSPSLTAMYDHYVANYINRSPALQQLKN